MATYSNSNGREGPNPLRPYYIPPSVGPLPAGHSANVSGASGYGSRTTHASKPSLGSSARDILSDLDYADYLSDTSPSAAAVIKGLFDQALWRYTSVLLGQPFEVAKTTLQVQLVSAVQAHKVENLRSSRASVRSERYEAQGEDSEADEQSYFSSSAPLPPQPRTPQRRFRASRRSSGESSPGPNYDSSPTPSSSSRHPRTVHKQAFATTSSITAVVSHLWTTEGAWGIWKGTNSTFIHSVLLSTLTAFTRSLICAFLGIPDPGLSTSSASPAYLIPMPSAVGGLDIISSPHPMMSLFAAVGASGLAGLILAPIDIARTRMMLTPSTHPPRSLLPALKTMGSWVVPFAIAPVTLFYSTLPTLISASTPLFLRSRMGIDPVLTPNMYAIATFASQAFEIAVRLPIETVLRRGQMATLSAPVSAANPRSRKVGLVVDTTVEIGPYKGLLGTMYHIVFEEGTRGPHVEQLVRASGNAAGVRPAVEQKKKGQGLEGLWRGWRVGMWGLVGVWSATSIGAIGGKGGEF